MKKITFLLIGVVLLGTSCKKYLDINNNPNQAIAATPQLILPQALTATANLVNNFNNYGAQVVGYMANAGGVGGFGTSFTYNYASSDYQNLWGGANNFNGTYDNLEDYQVIFNQSKGNPQYSYFSGVARIMKALDFQLLVDTYNDVPYTDALQGANKLTPAYTDAKAIYKDLAAQIDTAITEINAGASVTGVTPLGKADVMFGGDLTKWKQFANTLKLRLIVRSSGKVTFNNTTFSPEGFMTTDALINPGYSRDNGRQNPKWNNWGFAYTGGDANKSWMPNTFAFSFYNGTKLSDPYRGKAIYYLFPNTGTNRLGVESVSVPKSPSGSYWYPRVSRDGKSAGDTTGVLKGPDAGMPVITAAESYFLQAEAAVRGIITADAKDLFNKGIVASFRYLYTLPNGTTVVGDPAGDATNYVNLNNADYRVNFDLAASIDQKIEAIITQKYIALNMVNSDQAWDDYRRTHYPHINPAGDGTQTFASSVSESTRPDKLPTRILYPATEGAYNSANVPKGITPFTSTIFWAL